jgi:anaerobic carbon-monoxide dehydrogenase catalytic subunit
MGPCRLNARDPYSKVGVCGATIDTIMARNFSRMVASGAAAHTDHGMGMLDLFREVVSGKQGLFEIKDVQKLEQVAASIGIETEGREKWTSPWISIRNWKKPTRRWKAKSPLPSGSRPRPWKPGANKVVPRGAMREIMEMMHRTHMGWISTTKTSTQQCSRTALADGWGGSMVATEISDILYGTPKPVAVEVNMGVLKEDMVNVIVHGHEPNMFESMLASVNESRRWSRPPRKRAPRASIWPACAAPAPR